MHKAYSHLHEDADKGCHNGNLNWAFNVKQLLANCGMLNMWNEQYSMIPSINKQRIVHIHIQEWTASVNAWVKLCSYAIFTQSFTMETYLSCVQITKFRTILSRLGFHDLTIERGRCQHMERNTRLCKCCNMNVVENEYHFVLVCPPYTQLRSKHIKRYFCHWPRVNKCVQLPHPN
jgi:hypothetical protein